MPNQPPPPDGPGRIRRRMSSGVRKVVTFVAKRVAPRRRAGRSGSRNSLLQAHDAAVVSSGYRRWLPAALAAFMTMITGLVLWSMVSQLPTVCADTRTLARQIQELEGRIHAKAASPEQQEANEEAIEGLHSQEDKAQQERALLNEKIAKLRSDAEDARKHEQGLRDRLVAEERNLEQHKAQLRKLLGRNIEIHPGPPAHYDAGPEPKAPWYGGKLAYWVFSRREYAAKWDAWDKARTACDGFNAFQNVSGVELVELQGNLESINRQVAGFNEALQGVNARLTSLGQQLRRYTDAPASAWDDLNALRKRMATTAGVRMVFFCLDIPTLLSCLVTTAVAYSRMFLISGHFGPRQLARSRT